MNHYKFFSDFETEYEEVSPDDIRNTKYLFATVCFFVLSAFVGFLLGAVWMAK